MIKSYGVFAEFYDVLTANIDYKKRALYFDELIKRHDGKQGGLLLDLACGTGSLSEELDNLGYDIIAVDNSPEMLGIAMNKKIEHQKNIQYVCQDMRELDLYGTVDVAVCATNSLNYLQNGKELRTVFSKVQNFLTPGGLFFFDINSLYKFEKLYGDNTYLYAVTESEMKPAASSSSTASTPAVQAPQEVLDNIASSLPTAPSSSSESAPAE